MYVIAEYPRVGLFRKIDFKQWSKNSNLDHFYVNLVLLDQAVLDNMYKTKDLNKVMTKQYQRLSTKENDRIITLLGGLRICSTVH